jgi:dimethylargininase
MLVNRRWVNIQRLAEFDLIDAPNDEPWAANTLTIGDVVFIADGFSRTRVLLKDRGFDVRAIDISELRKAEAGLTCMSLVFNAE